MTRATDTVVFLGPSMPVAAARPLLDADFRPPAARGDVYRCLGSGVRRLVLIDGLFHATPSVWQRELLAAIDEGLEVLGASSMGALRAAELHPLGMIGHGTIFGWYRDGVIDGDDEVALLHGDAESGWARLSEPMVNVRATLAGAVAAGLLTPEEGAQLVDEAKRTYYPQRSLQGLLSGTTARSWPEARRRALDQWLSSGRLDVKRADAEGLLRHCAATPIVERSAPGLRDLAWSWELARARELSTGESGEALIERAYREGVGETVMPRLARRWYVCEWARARGQVCPDEVLERFRRREEAGRGDLSTWLRERRVTRAEYEGWMRGRALEDWLATRDAPPDGRDERLSALAREYLADWGVEAGAQLPGPTELGFQWPSDHAFLLELLLGEEGERAR